MLKLPPELIAEILGLLVPDNTSLHSICLSGNRTLLSIAPPLTWRHISILHDNSLCHRSSTCLDGNCVPGRLKIFANDPRKARSVRSVTMRLRGESDTGMPFFQALAECLPKLLNAAAAHLIFYEMCLTFHECHDAVVRSVASWLPALRNLRVDGCNLPELLSEWDPKCSIAPMLTRVECRHCHPQILELIRYTPSIEELSVTCGDGKQAWSELFKSDKTDYHGYEGQWLDLQLLCDKPLGMQLRRLVLVAPAPNMETDGLFNGHDDLACILADPDPDPVVTGSILPNLASLALWGYQLELEDLQALLISLCRDGIESIKLSAKNDIPASILVSMLVSVADHFSELSSLRSLWLPIDDIHDDYLASLSDALSRIPRLTGLYFDKPKEWQSSTLARCVAALGRNIGTLCTLSWHQTASVVIHRDRAPSSTYDGYTVVDYTVPAWTLP